MTGEQLKQALIQLHGSHGWQATAARRLRIDASSLRRYAGGQLPVPGPVEAAVRSWLGLGDDEPLDQLAPDRLDSPLSDPRESDQDPQGEQDA
jgi:hypothetical protein